MLISRFPIFTWVPIIFICFLFVCFATHLGNPRPQHQTPHRQCCTCTFLAWKTFAPWPGHGCICRTGRWIPFWRAAHASVLFTFVMNWRSLPATSIKQTWCSRYPYFNILDEIMFFPTKTASPRCRLRGGASAMMTPAMMTSGMVVRTFKKKQKCYFESHSYHHLSSPPPFLTSP